MKIIPTYHLFHTIIIALLIIGQVWVSTAPYFHTMIHSSFETIEHYNSPEDNESEEHEDNKKEKELQVQVNLYSNYFIESSQQKNIRYSKYFFALSYSQITTPPPEFLNIA